MLRWRCVGGAGACVTVALDDFLREHSSLWAALLQKGDSECEEQGRAVGTVSGQSSVASVSQDDTEESRSVWQQFGPLVRMIAFVVALVFISASNNPNGAL